jgi:hypothetical protein
MGGVNFLGHGLWHVRMTSVDAFTHCLLLFELSDVSGGMCVCSGGGRMCTPVPWPSSLSYRAPKKSSVATSSRGDDDIKAGLCNYSNIAVKHTATMLRQMCASFPSSHSVRPMLTSTPQKAQERPLKARPRRARAQGRRERQDGPLPARHILLADHPGRAERPRHPPRPARQALHQEEQRLPL